MGPAFDRAYLFNKIKNGGFHADDSTYSSGAAVGGSPASLALQPILGLLPQRWSRLSGRSVARAASGRATVKLVALCDFLRGVDSLPGSF